MPGAKHLTINDADTRVVFRLGLGAVRVSPQATLMAGEARRRRQRHGHRRWHENRVGICMGLDDQDKRER